MSDTPNPILDGYVTREQLAQMLGRHPDTIKRWDASRTGPPKTLLGGGVVYRIEAVRQWLAAREQKQPRAGAR